MRRASVLLMSCAALLMTPVVALAAPKTQCGAASSGWELLTVDQAADRIWPELVGGPFANVEDLAADIDSRADRNDDDNVCLREMWGQDVNPKSHWYVVGPVTNFLVTDNAANAS